MGVDGRMMRRAVFLDRDGVINHPVIRACRPFAPGSLAELRIMPGVPHALHALRAAGYRLVVVTNQPEVARGTTQRATLVAMHEWLKSVLPLDEVFTCEHDDADRCSCRKPLPGLITHAATHLDIECAASYMIGDRWRDIEAGRRAGCKTLFVDHGYDEPVPESFDFRVTSLWEAASLILRADALR
jgi:D-glycero-D-manno-heptose 1,7-bisphosphate phosphatase